MYVSDKHMKGHPNQPERQRQVKPQQGSFTDLLGLPEQDENST